MSTTIGAYRPGPGAGPEIHACYPLPDATGDMLERVGGGKVCWA